MASQLPDASYMGSEEVFQAIVSFLEEKKIDFKRLEHEPTYTSEESAKARNEDVSIGGKALLMKMDDKFNLFVLSASKKLNSKKCKQLLKAKSIRFANSAELYEMTKLVPGCVPPFGKPVLPFDLYLDESIASNEKIAFNAGLLTKSIVMNVSDYLTAAQPTVLSFSE